MIVRIHQTNSLHKFPIVAEAIKFCQKTKYSHYSIELFSSTMIDATGKGVQGHNREDFWKLHKPYKMWEFNIDAYESDVAEWFHKLQGHKYGYMQVFGLAMMNLGIFKVNPFGRNSKRIICNELVILFLKKFMGVKFTDTDNYDLKATEKFLNELLDDRLIRVI